MNLRSKLKSLFSRRKLDAEMATEMREHLERRVEANVAAGMSAEEARYAALRQFGGVEQLKEIAREQRPLVWLEQLGRDVQYAIRSLRRSPGLVVTAVLSLGLGVGANLALFAGLQSAFFGLPTSPHVARLVGIEPGNSNRFTYPDYRDLRDSAILEDVLGYYPMRLSLQTGDAVEKVMGLAVTENFFSVLGVNVASGREFLPGEAAPEREPRFAILSHSFARRHASVPADLIGQHLTLNGQAFLVLGILPPDHRAVTVVTEPDVYVPLSNRLIPNLHARQNGIGLAVNGRLPPGSTVRQAETMVTAWGVRREREQPEENPGLGRPAKVFPVRGSLLRGVPSEFFLLSSAMAGLFALVLLIACANVAGLLLARSANRRRETAVRVALGAGRGRLIQLLLVESGLLALAGTAAGLLLAHWTILALRLVSIPGGLPLKLAIKPDASLFLAGIGLAAITTLLCGIVPAFRATKVSLVDEIQQGGGHGGSTRLGWRNAFVVSQIAASVLLLVVSSLFVRSLQRIAEIDPGFQLDQAVVAKIELGSRSLTDAARVSLAENVQERLLRLPGIRSAALANLVPLGGDSYGTSFERRSGQSSFRGRANFSSVGPGYFETMGIALRQGRDFQVGDRSGAPVVAIINQTFARIFFPGENPIGQRLAGQSPDPAQVQEIEVVGVVSDSKYSLLSEDPKPLLYHAYAQKPGRLIVQMATAASANGMSTAVRRALLELDSNLIAEVQTMREATDLEFRLRRMGSTLLGVLGGLGLLLALVGLYGVMTFVVTARTSEIGIRMALGATPRQVVWAIVRQGLRVVLLGIGVGVALALLLTRPLGFIFAGISAADPLALFTSMAALILTGLAASYLPALRAARVDPMLALRCE